MKKPEASSATIVGAGLVGSLLSIYLAKKGIAVEVLEKRVDPRAAVVQEGRSINLALSHRGLRALKEASEHLYEEVLKEAVPMYGRQIHDEESKLSFQAYGANNQCIYSVSRARLNRCLINEAEKQGVQFLFEHSIEHADVVDKQLSVKYRNELKIINAPLLFAADGAFSRIRVSLEEGGFCSSQIERIEHGYKELDIAPTQGKLIANKNALHVWPRGEYMFIALPNFDESYTGTLFLPFKEEGISFKNLDKAEAVELFFKTHFPDTLQLVPDLTEQYHNNPTSFLANVYTDRWAFDTWLLIGDAAHGIVPFYGQGMNSGFEDCRILNDLLTEHQNSWSAAFKAFQDSRKVNTDAIARLAMDNFIEMRDLVADENFLLQKEIEGALMRELPDIWKSLYSEVSFSDTPYSEALQIGKNNERIMQQIMSDASIDLSKWNQKEEWEKIVTSIRLQLTGNR